MSFMDAIKSGFSNYITIDGRAARSEYWFWVLFLIIGSIAAGIIDSVGGLGNFGSTGVVGALFSLGTLLPSITVGIRRLHDLNRTGLWILLVLVPVIGGIILLIFFVMRGTEGGNDYGPDPLAGAD